MLNLIFSGLVKNSLTTLKKNIDFLAEFKAKYPELNITLLVMESDSVDGTKEFLKTLNYDWIDSYTEDRLDEKFNYRTEKIAYCRNFLLKKINLKNYKKAIYIPVDLDIKIFEYIEIKYFYDLIIEFTKNPNIDALFPYGYPYYYDLHALRAHNWNTKSPWELVNKINKFTPIGKFFSRYFFVYRKQKKYKDIKKLLPVESAFGGIGLYKIDSKLLQKAYYSIDVNLGNHSCEHVVFNEFFNKKFIDCKWRVPSPIEHIEFKLLNNRKKIIYISNSIKSDFKNLIT